MPTRRRWNRQAQLVDLQIYLKENEKGEYEVYRKGRKLNRQSIPTSHKYGKTQIYYKYSFYGGMRDGRQYMISILEHVLVWLWFKGDIPDGMDLDHIDNDKSNNHISNLQLLTRAENIKKRGMGRNQYSAHMTDDEILTLRQTKINKKNENQEKILRGKLTALELKKDAFKDKVEFHKNNINYLTNKRKITEPQQRSLERSKRMLIKFSKRIKDMETAIELAKNTFAERII